MTMGEQDDMEGGKESEHAGRATREQGQGVIKGHRGE